MGKMENGRNRNAVQCCNKIGLTVLNLVSCSRMSIQAEATVFIGHEDE
jgi:hypothetical protein